ncbi:MAG: Lrp/AsnC family transcriptional regulator [Candidatus Bathyarchaeia archaeon]
MLKLKPIDYAIIAELTRNSRLTDSQLAKMLKTSPPTITRRRTELEKHGLLDYTAVPNMEKLGYQIVAFIFGNWHREKFPDTRVEEIKKFISRTPNIVYISTGSGMGYDRMAIAFFKDYSEYSRIMREFRNSWGQYFSNLSAFLVSLQRDNILRNFTFKPLMENMKMENAIEQPRKNASS